MVRRISSSPRGCTISATTSGPGSGSRPPSFPTVPDGGERLA